jgi:hypothetical protein
MSLSLTHPKDLDKASSLEEVPLGPDDNITKFNKQFRMIYADEMNRIVPFKNKNAIKYISAIEYISILQEQVKYQHDPTVIEHIEAFLADLREILKSNSLNGGTKKCFKKKTRNKKRYFIPLKNSIRTADDSLSKLPVTDLKKAPLKGADSNKTTRKKLKCF